MTEELSVTQEKILGQNPRIVISGIKIDVLDMSGTMDLVEEYVQTKTPLHLMGVNADKINAANENARLKAIINSCGIINADGASLVMASQYLGFPLPERVAGIDLMMNLVGACEERQHSVYLLGAKQEVVELTEKKLKQQHPDLQILGIHNGYFSQEEWPEISRELKQAAPDFVFVGITSPMKEYLIEYLQDDGNTCVFMGVGGSFDVISGKLARAPKWMQKCSLEWLYRVIQEPKRLFKRYFVGNLKFIRTIAAEKRTHRR